MNRARAWTLAVVGASIAALAAPTIAPAALPKPRQALIAPFVGFGKVKLGITKSRAFEIWGQADDCRIGTGGRDTCVWFSSSRTDFPVEGGVLELNDGKVCGMFIRAGTNFRDGSLTITRLKRWKTEEGVGLGSRMRAAKRVLGGRTIKTRHHVTTLFRPGTSQESRRKVGQIDIFKENCPVT
jgi:hypothetical protein